MKSPMSKTTFKAMCCPTTIIDSTSHRHRPPVDSPT
jgi:hypothetical protein